jgi:hypothetical protein
MKNRQRGGKRDLRRKRVREQRSVDESIEELLLELADDAFSLMRMVCVRVRPARVAYSSKARSVRRNSAMTMGSLDRCSIDNHKEQKAT